MSIENSDMKMFLRFRESNPEGTSCAILGDVSLHSLSGMDEFKNLLGFDIVHTFDINGNPNDIQTRAAWNAFVIDSMFFVVRAI